MTYGKTKEESWKEEHLKDVVWRWFIYKELDGTGHNKYDPTNPWKSNYVGYDPWKESVDFDSRDPTDTMWGNIYRFRIQTYDSPEGDTWWVGKFKFRGGNIDILEDGNEHT